MSRLEGENQNMREGEQKLKRFFEAHDSVAIAFSGGVDSAVLLLLAKKYAKRIKAYYVHSQFQPDFEREDALQTAQLLNAELEMIPTDILAFEHIAANPKNRCYYCKKEIFGNICKHALQDGFLTVLEGTNASDDIAERPGFLALKELQVLSPLRSCGIEKQQIRWIAKEHALPVADKPSYACLATRIPANTAIRARMLQVTQEAEDAMRKVGFQNFRVRYLGGDAKIELSRQDFELFYQKREQVYHILSRYYPHVYLNLKERADESR